jgi:RNA polymerase sigma-70 factor (ECF subfamily)
MAVSSPRARLRLVGGTAGARRAPRDLGPTGELDDAALVALARDNHTVAFEALYRRHASFALNLAVRIQGSATDVEDVVHDAFLRAQHRLAELREATSFRSWLGAIVVRLVRTRLRRRRLLGLLGLAHADPVDMDAIASNDAGPEARAQLAQIYALLQTMPPNERIAWTLRNIERHRLEAVAELTGCSLATAKRRIQRAQQFLNDHFVAPFEEEQS